MKEDKASHAKKILRSEKMNLLSTYKDRRSIHVRIGRVLPEMELV